MEFETSAARIWKKLSREDKKRAAATFLEDPPPELYAGALSAVIRVRKLRPQVARALAPEALADALSTVLDPGEPLVSSLLIALHLGSRRPLLVAFLDALGVPHENGLLKEEADAFPAPEAGALRKATAAVAPSFPPDQLAVYFNTLVLQDPERWQGLAGYEDWLK
jgi:hypothetical protein